MVDFSQLNNMNALMPVQAFQAGREQRDTRLAGEAQNALMAGNREQAMGLAQRTGNADVMQNLQQQIAQMDEAQRQQARERANAFGQVGAGLLQVPYEQRRAALSNPQVQQQLSGFGIDPQQLAGFDPTDENLYAALAPVAEISDLLDRTAPMSLGANDTRVDPVSGQQIVGRAGVETRQLREQELGIQQQNADTARVRASQPRGPGVVVQTGNPGPQVGTIPQGYQLVQDPASGAYRMEPIPGGPAAQEVEQGRRQAAARQAQNEQFSDIVTDDIGRAVAILEDNPGAGGRMGAVMRVDPESQTRDLERLYSTIGAYTAFDRLQRMRDASPTGGALGQVSNIELQLLQNAYGALDVTAPPQTQIYNLRRLEELILDTVHGPGNRPGAARGQEPDQPPPGIDPADWEFMSPEERALFQ